MECRLFCCLLPFLLKIYVNSISFTRLHNAFLNLESSSLLCYTAVYFCEGEALVSSTWIHCDRKRWLGKLIKGHSFGHHVNQSFHRAEGVLQMGFQKRIFLWLEATFFDQGSWWFWICRSPIYLPKVILPPFGNKILWLVTARPQRWSIWSILQGLAYVGFAFCGGISYDHTTRCALKWRLFFLTVWIFLLFNPLPPLYMKEGSCDILFTMWRNTRHKKFPLQFCPTQRWLTLSIKSFFASAWNSDKPDDDVDFYLFRIAGCFSIPKLKVKSVTLGGIRSTASDATGRSSAVTRSPAETTTETLTQSRRRQILRQQSPAQRSIF